MKGDEAFGREGLLFQRGGKDLILPPVIFIYCILSFEFGANLHQFVALF